MATIPRQNKTAFLFLIILFVMSFFKIGYAGEVEQDESLHALVNFGIAYMIPGQTKTFTAESDTLSGSMMIIPVLMMGNYTFAQNVLNISIAKSSVGEVIAVMQNGNGYPDSSYNIGVTPRSLSLEINFWNESGATIVYSALLFSMEEGPYTYTVTLSYR